MAISDESRTELPFAESLIGDFLHTTFNETGSSSILGGTTRPSEFTSRRLGMGLISDAMGCAVEGEHAFEEGDGLETDDMVLPDLPTEFNPSSIRVPSIQSDKRAYE